jgi:hypothetical protein
MGGADCELVGGGWLAQPVNAWSSLAYLAAAGFVASRRRDAVAVLGAIALVLVGVGSFAYHGPQPGWAGPLHDASIVVLLGIVLFAVGRRGPPPPVAVVALLAGGLLYVMGRTGAPLCSPSSVVQLHAGWHVATAVAAGAVLALSRRASAPRRSRSGGPSRASSGRWSRRTP